jgi:hypothetical protein
MNAVEKMILFSVLTVVMVIVRAKGSLLFTGDDARLCDWVSMQLSILCAIAVLANAAWIFCGLMEWLAKALEMTFSSVYAWWSSFRAVRNTKK